MNRALLFHAWRSQRLKLAFVGLGLAVWSALLPIIYATFGEQFEGLVDSGLIPEQLAEFGGGDIFSLSGAIALGAIHPISLILNSVFAVGYAAAAVAGERQRGTLEVVLARPLSRRVVYVTLLVSALAFVGLALLATIAGAVAGASLAGLGDQIQASRLPLFWLNGLLLFGAIAAIGLAASVSFDRLTPALGITVGVVVVMYFLEVLGSFWPDARGLQPYSLFHHFRPKEVLEGNPDPVDFALLAAVFAGAVGWALAVFPRRDLAAPS